MSTNCPVCKAESTSVVKFNETVTLFKCKQCFWLFVPNAPIKLFEKLNLNEEKRNEYLAIVQKASEYVDLKSGDKVLDIHSGDGTLLGWYKKTTVTVGIEPDAKLMKEALNHKRVDVPIIKEFKPEVIDGHIGKFKIITIVDTFQEFAVLPLLTSCREILTSEGVIVVQTPYFPQLLSEKATDFPLSRNYFLTYTLRNLFLKAGLELRGVEFPKKGIRGYGTYPGFKRFCISDFDAKLKLHTQMTASMIAELHNRYDLDVAYRSLDEKFNPIPLGVRNEV